MIPTKFLCKPIRCGYTNHIALIVLVSQLPRHLVPDYGSAAGSMGDWQSHPGRQDEASIRPLDGRVIMERYTPGLPPKFRSLCPLGLLPQGSRLAPCEAQLRDQRHPDQSQVVVDTPAQ